MKTLRKMTAAALLTCVLTVSVSAGDMWTGYTPPPPPPTAPPPASAVASEETGDVLSEVVGSLLSGLITVL